MNTNTRFGLHSTRNKIFRFCMGISSVYILMFAFFTLFPYYEDIERAKAEGAPNAVQSTINLDVTSSTAELNFSWTGGTSGTFASSSDAITFDASTNNASGYTIKYIGSNDTGALTHEDGEFSFSSISSPLTLNDFSATANSAYNNQWGFKPSKYVSGNSVVNNTGAAGVFLPVPTTTGVIIDKTNAPNANEENYTIEIGARADMSIVAGEYTGNYNLLITANPVSYRITYAAGNTTDEIQNLPETQNSSTSDTSITLSSETPTRAHHSFLGWCDVLPTTTNGTDSCTGTNEVTGSPATQYAVGSDFGINQTTQNNTTLYAMWQIDTFTQTTRYRYENTDGTWGSWTTAETVSKNYGSSYSWSTSQISNFNSTAYQAASVASYTVTGAKTNDVSIYRKTFSCKINSGLQNTDGTYPSTYTSQVNSTVRYGGTCSWSVAATTSHQAASYSNTNVTANVSQNVNVPRKTFTCTKQYRLQNADGTWGNYTADGSVAAYYGGSCAYAKTVTDYKNSASGTNGAQASTSATNVTANQTLSLSFYRNTYALTVTAGTNTSSATGGGTKRWGEAATVGVTKAANATCTAYGTPTWTQSGTAGTFSATSGTSVTFTMGKGNATVTATSAATNVAQTITLSRSGGAASIVIAGTGYTGTSVSLNCGTYNISGTYSSNYEFSSWARANGVAVANTAAASTIMTVTGAGTLTLNGKQSCASTVSGNMQNFNPATLCSSVTSGTLTDSRDGTSYNVAKLADGKWWLLDNLALDLTNTTVQSRLTSSTTNASDTTLNYLKNGGGTTSDQHPITGVTNWTSGRSFSDPLIETTNKDTTGTGGYESGKYGIYYNFCAASAGSFCYGNGLNGGTPSGNATEDICPKGWRIPTGGGSGEYDALYTAYNSDYAGFVNALHTPLAGAYSDGATVAQAEAVSFWSSIYGGGRNMYTLSISTSSVNSQNLVSRSYGYHVRCVLQQ